MGRILTLLVRTACFQARGGNAEHSRELSLGRVTGGYGKSKPCILSVEKYAKTKKAQINVRIIYLP